MISYIKFITIMIFLIDCGILMAQNEVHPDEITFVRQGVRRYIFNENQQIPLSLLEPSELIGLPVMHPVTYYADSTINTRIKNGRFLVTSDKKSPSALWFGGFNPFATYTIDLASFKGLGEIGFDFSDAENTERFLLTISFANDSITDVTQKIYRQGKTVIDESIAINLDQVISSDSKKIILQLLGSGLTVYIKNKDLPVAIGQIDFAEYIDLREKQYLHSLQSNLYINMQGEILIDKIQSTLSTGVGLADIRAITYEDGTPFIDQNRVWYTMTMRGRALPHPLQGVFSLDPTVFDLQFEGVIVFDRADGLLRNDVASHIFYDRKDSIWRGITTGFSAFAKPGEKKQLLSVYSKKDPRFGFSVMKANPLGIEGDIEDPHIIYDHQIKKWRILACENINGYKAVLMESENWNRGYHKISGPVIHNSTGVSIQKIGNKRYCFSGSSERKIYIYSYPDLIEKGILNIDLPPWNSNSGSRIWPNIIELPADYPFRYISLMMDRFNYPSIQGPQWSYGAIYLFHGYIR
ncbi:hypothetical protein [Autumnicola musiva]|uniref:Uncharacterized protein n=1 Tax=Autumnicola musiva TaxID=3075589 RepID=A0ABU3D8P4_9FLAO|nr:hypothetical protein [Zunongwangia sp. F117]MDT0677902.1 hypothetical protein [Zunongwangia sp. F117]